MGVEEHESGGVIHSLRRTGIHAAKVNDDINAAPTRLHVVDHIVTTPFIAGVKRIVAAPATLSQHTTLFLGGVA